jgi:hypothetical protein
MPRPKTAFNEHPGRKASTEKPVDDSAHELANYLAKSFAKAGHGVWELGSVVVLNPRRECPFWTVQFRSRGKVLWFVDFPMDCTQRAVIAFIEGL